MPKYAGSDANQITFAVQGVPIPKQSTRFTKTGHAYTPQRIKNWQELIGFMAVEARLRNGLFKLLDCFIAVEYTFYLPDRRHRDLDNLAKGVSDALEGIIFKNDNQIVEQHLYKRVDKEDPRVVISVGKP
jgi:Holliday junction resolvase RusA-like endonuclease